MFEVLFEDSWHLTGLAWALRMVELLKNALVGNQGSMFTFNSVLKSLPMYRTLQLMIHLALGLSVPVICSFFQPSVVSIGLNACKH